MMEYAIQLGATLFVFSVVMGYMYLLTWMERKQSALMQDRIGPNRANPLEIFGYRGRFALFGLFQSVADAIKMVTKEDFIPPGGNRFLHTVAPMAAMFFALVSFAVIPFGGTYQIGGYTVSLQLLDLNVGLLYVFAMMSMGIYGFVLAGWSSANNYSLLGGLRASSQMISYEITMGATVIGLIMVYGTLSLQEMNQIQGQLLWGWLPMWGVLLQPLGFILFTTAAMAETKRTPFDVPEGESEIVGYFVEYSGLKFAMFFSADFLETILAACLITTLFFGGWQVPFLESDGFRLPGGLEIFLSQMMVMVLQVTAFLVKVFLCCFCLLLVRWTLPRFRWDHLMRLGWTIMLPLSIANIVVTGLVLLLIGK